MVAILERRNYRDFDWLVAVLAIAIVCFGVWQIYNAQPEADYWSKQIVGLVIALIALLVIALTDYRRVIDAAPFFYGFGLLLLIFVLIPGLGVRINGQQAWLQVPFIGRFQPSEFVKITVVLMLAKYFGARKSGTLTLKELLIGGAILAAPVGLIMLRTGCRTSFNVFSNSCRCLVSFSGEDPICYFDNCCRIDFCSDRICCRSKNWTH